MVLLNLRILIYRIKKVNDVNLLKKQIFSVLHLAQK